MKRWTRAWTGVALLLFWGAGLWHVGTPAFWYDELFNVNLILGHDLPGMMTVLRTQQPYPPLYFLCLKGWAALTGARPYAPGLEPGSGLEFLLRAPSVLAGVLLLAMLVPLGRRLRLPGATSLPWLLALHPLLLWYARDARMYAVWMTLTLAAIYALTANRRWLWWLAATAALLTHYFALFPLAGAAAVAPAVRRWGTLAAAGASRRVGRPLCVSTGLDALCFACHAGIPELRHRRPA